MAEPMHSNTMIPGGAIVKKADVPEVNGIRHLPAGSLVGRTFSERSSNVGFYPVTVVPEDAGPPIVPAHLAEEEIYLTAFDVTDANKNVDVELLRHGVVIYEDRLDGWSTLDATKKAWIRANYQCIVSVDG